ncbi:MAG: ribulose-phosphate 3-epimerase [Thermoleophilaceae bacterium]
MNSELLDDRRVAPSILASDFARLGAQVESVMDAGARVIHVDVMDGHFVPPISIGPLIVDALREQVHAAGGMLDVHLMIERPERSVQDFVSAGADSISVHFEATPHVHYALHAIRAAGCRAGLALNPGTPPSVVDSLAGAYDLLLCMTVNPGWGGQPYIAASDAKIAALRDHIPAGTPIEVDGGIDTQTAGPAAAAGATLFVAGSSVFGSPDPAAAYRAVAAAAGAV